MPVYEFECPNGTITEKLVRMNTKEICLPKMPSESQKNYFSVYL